VSDQWRGTALTPGGQIHFAVNDPSNSLVWASYQDRDDNLKLRKKSTFHDAFAEYAEGNLSAFTGITVEQDGTEFSASVYDRMREIPPGSVETYGQLAARAGFPRAARAVGTVCARNQAALVIPCHRVVSSNGLGGYGYGPEIKLELLAHEGVDY